MATHWQQYLNEVLGVNGIVLPSTLAKSPNRSVTLVISPFAMDDLEKNMAQKMVGAADLAPPLFLSSEEISDEQILKIAQDTPVKAIIFFGLSVRDLRTLSKLNSEHIELPAISKFLKTTNDEELKIIKRSAWAKLQDLKKIL